MPGCLLLLGNSYLTGRLLLYSSSIYLYYGEDCIPHCPGCQFGCQTQQNGPGPLDQGRKLRVKLEHLWAGAQGFEPQLTDPESAVLPLDDAPIAHLLYLIIGLMSNQLLCVK